MRRRVGSTPMPFRRQGITPRLAVWSPPRIGGWLALELTGDGSSAPVFNLLTGLGAGLH